MARIEILVLSLIVSASDFAQKLESQEQNFEITLFKSIDSVTGRQRLASAKCPAKIQDPARWPTASASLSSNSFTG
jgi:hypothetical protein